MFRNPKRHEWECGAGCPGQREELCAVCHECEPRLGLVTDNVTESRDSGELLSSLQSGVSS